MKTCNCIKIFFSLMLCTQLAYAKSPCYKLATTTFFDSSISPTVSTPETLKDAKNEMADGETFCKRVVQFIKTKGTTSEIVKTKADEMLKEAKDEFERDGDMDKLELAKYHYALTVGSAQIAEELP